LTSKTEIYQNAFVNFYELKVLQAIVFIAFKNYESVSKCVVLKFVPKRVKKNSIHAHNTGSWYLLGIFSKFSTSIPLLYIWMCPAPPPPSPPPPTISRWQILVFSTTAPFKTLEIRYGKRKRIED